MTEKLSALSTQSAVPSQPVLVSAPPPAVQDAPRPAEQAAEGEEPYTIKCICGFTDDDGNTVYCETCDTWQHTFCFYPNNGEDANRDDFDHSCHDCKPRPLDRQQAVERQRQRLGAPLSVTKNASTKPRRPPSKNHKKKLKPSELQLNGHAPSENPNKHSIPHEHPPAAKKAKSAHKPSQSISSHAKRSPSYGTTRANHGHPPSPANTPPELPLDFEIHNYSSGFISLHADHDLQITSSNTFANLNISNTLSLWLRQPDRMREDTNQTFEDVFNTWPAHFDSVKPSLRVEFKKILLPGETIARVQYLTSTSPVEKDTPLMELNGQVGFQKDYCVDPDSRWEEVSSPLPFVFFHPMLPLYIDTRREGSRARYVRRSCKPNTVLDTYLSDGSEYQFWLVSDRHIGSHEQITIPWDFRLPTTVMTRWLHLLGLGDDDVRSDEPEIDSVEYARIASWIHLVLSEYGGCACDLGSNCAFARFHRNSLAKIQTRPNPSKKKPRKPKNHTISPTSTGQATNSRAASEGHLDDGLDLDGRSMSDSRSKPPSRDMTPPRQGSFDTLGILTEPTDRDKRKVAMVEDSFRRLEQQPSRKKKRASDGTGNPNPKAKPRTSTVTNGVTYVDAGTSRSKSGSPASVISPSMGHGWSVHAATRQVQANARSRHTSSTPRPTYCDAAVQTDPVEGEWYSGASQSPKPRRRIVSLSKRLLDNCHRRRQEEEERRKLLETLRGQSDNTTAMEVDTPDTKLGLHSPSVASEPEFRLSTPAPSGDTIMTDTSPATNDATNVPAITTSAAPSLPSPVLNKSPDLRVQLPPVPTFSNSTSALGTATTPLSASSLVQSPFTTTLPSPFGPSAVNGIAATPSPIKKKLSLSDYTKSRKAAAGRPSVGTSLKASTSNVDDPKSATSVDSAVAADSPTAEKTVEAQMTALTTTPLNGAI
jgi:uncharacterized protein